MQARSLPIALVDDNPALLVALQRCLVTRGFEAQTFASAERYLEQVRPGEFACAVIDIDLGKGLSGLDLGEQMLSAGHATPIVFMSGTQNARLCERARDVGCIEFLEKPFAIAQLLEALAKVA